MATEDLTFRFNVTGNAVPQFQKVQQQISRVDRQVKAANRTISTHARQYNATSVATNKWAKGALQQAGFQVGDFAVQVANGTNKMQAFGQQGSQLLGIFGPVGAVLGAAVAIFSAVSVAISKASSASEEAEKPVVSLSSALSKLGDNAQLVGEQFDLYLSKTFSDAEADVQALVDRLDQVRLETFQQSISDLLSEAGKPLQDTEDEFDRITEAIRTNYEEMLKLGNASAGARMAFMDALDDAEDFQDETGMSIRNFQIFLDNLEEIKRANSFEELSRSVATMNAHLDGLAEGPMENFANRLVSLLDQQGIFDRMGQDAEEMGDSVDDAGGSTDEAAKSARLLSIELSNAAQSALAVQSALAAAPGALAGMRERGQILQAEIDALTSGAGQLDASVEAFRKRRELELNATEAVTIAQAQAIADQIDAEAEVFQANQQRLEQLGKLRKALTDTGSAGSGAARQIAEAVNTDLKEAIEQLTPLEEKMQSLGKSIAGSFEDAMMSAVDGTKTVAESFRSMAASIIKELYRVFVVKKITGFIEGAIGGLAGPGLSSGQAATVISELPGALAGRRAMGGPVTGQQPYMVGEKGPELFVPSRSGHIVPNNQMGNGNGVTVNQTINVSTGVAQTVRTEIKSLMPQIADSAKAAVADAKLRGGSYGRAF
jgi:hypothetical protein